MQDEHAATRADESPFLLTRAACPVCRTVNEYETIQPGAFTESGTDTDFRPIARTWANPRYENINPLLYYMATCTSCFYTQEFGRLLRMSAAVEASPAIQKRIRQKHLALLADPQGLMRRLGASLCPDTYPVQTAINKLLLGIIDEQLLDKPSSADLGRWYLRVAWLMREVPIPQRGTSANTRSHADIARDIAGMKSDLQHVCERGSNLLRQVVNESSTVRRESNQAEATSRIESALLHCVGQIEGLMQVLADAQHAMSNDSNPMVGSETHTSGDPYGDFASYSDFLRALKVDGAAIPANEDDALTLALMHHRRAFENEGGIGTGGARLVSAYMIGELSRRLARWTDARQFLDIAHAAGQDLVAQCGSDKPRSALARHIVNLAQSQLCCVHEQEPSR